MYLVYRTSILRLFSFEIRIKFVSLEIALNISVLTSKIYAL